MHSDRMEFDRSPKPIASPIFRLLQTRGTYFEVRETPVNGSSEWMVVGFEKSNYLQMWFSDTLSERSLYLHYFGKESFHPRIVIRMSGAFNKVKHWGFKDYCFASML